MVDIATIGGIAGFILLIAIVILARLCLRKATNAAVGGLATILCCCLCCLWKSARKKKTADEDEETPEEQEVVGSSLYVVGIRNNEDKNYYDSNGTGEVMSRENYMAEDVHHPSHQNSNPYPDVHLYDPRGVIVAENHENFYMTPSNYHQQGYIPNRFGRRNFTYDDQMGNSNYPMDEIKSGSRNNNSDVIPEEHGQGMMYGRRY